MDDAFELTEQEKHPPGKGVQEVPGAGEDADRTLAELNQHVVRGLLAGMTVQRSDLEMRLRDIENEHRREQRSLYLQILNLVDSLDRILRSADPENDLANSVEVLRSQFFQFLEDHEILPVEIEVGQIFDPTCCEVSTRKPRPDLPPDVILSIERRGYAYQSRSLRKARVTISYQP